ncbi:MAG: hypothetical protein H7Y02_02775, partial [Candidatus Obscuribacterales bacterium]|nr:hypothetical protein [Steroidobacteraceae bacterium]
MQMRWFMSRARNSMHALSAVAVATLLLTGAVHVQAQTPVPMQTLPDFRELVRSNQASVVNISTTQKVPTRMSVPSPGVPWERLPEDSPLRDFFKRYERGMPQEREANSLGSGFIISA